MLCIYFLAKNIHYPTCNKGTQVYEEYLEYLQGTGGQAQFSAMAVLSSLPVGHVIKVLCELCQVGTLLFILFLCPKQNFWDLPRKKRRGVGKSHTLKWDSQLQPLLTATCCDQLCPTAGVWESWQGIPDIAEGPNPPTALSPPLSLYLDFIEEFSIQQGQLLGYFMTVEIMQCPWPVENNEEVQRLRKCDLFSYLSCILN